MVADTSAASASKTALVVSAHSADFVWRAGGMKMLRVHSISGQLWRAGLFITASAFFVTSVGLMPLPTVIALTFTAPLFVTALAPTLLGEHVGWRRWMAVIAGLERADHGRGQSPIARRRKRRSCASRAGIGDELRRLRRRAKPLRTSRGGSSSSCRDSSALSGTCSLRSAAGISSVERLSSIAQRPGIDLGWPKLLVNLG